MKSDYQDWGELEKKATSILKNKILGIHPIIQLLVQTSSEDDFRIDMVKSQNNTYRLEKLSWKRIKDNVRMNDPLEKIKLFGHYAPTFERESYMLNDNSRITILNLLDLLVKKEKEYRHSDTSIVLEGVKHTMNINHLDINIQTIWKLNPESWKIIPTIKDLLFELTNSRYDKE